MVEGQSEKGSEQEGAEREGDKERERDRVGGGRVREGPGDWWWVGG